MATTQNDFHSLGQESNPQLSNKDIQAQRFQPRSYNNNNNNNNNNKKPPLRVQVSKTPRNSVKIKPTGITVHFTWALVLTIICFFVIGPCWALYKTIELRRMIEREEAEAAGRLSHKITTVLVVSTILGVIVWVAVLFCSVGLLITGQLLNSRVI